MRRLLAIATLALLGASSAHAVPAPPFPFEVRDADGTRHAVRMFGDERLSWFEDLQGYAVAFDARRGAWTLAVHDSAGRLQPGEHRVGTVDPRSVGIAPHLAPGATSLRQARMLAGAPRPPAFTQLQGTVPNLVLLVRFKDQQTTFTAADFETLFNGPTGSVREYYQEISYAKLDLVSTVVGWIDLPNDASYYAYNSANPFGRPGAMLIDAIAQLDAAKFDFTRFDSNHDGVLDAIDIIHSGPGYEGTGNPAYIHSHYSSLVTFGRALETHDGIAINAYHTEPEFRPGGGITQIGVICHETGHFFGLPDLYDYGYDSAGLGLWCIMSSGSWAGPNHDGTRPTHPCAWARAQLGFTQPRRVEADAQLRLAPIETGGEAIVLSSGLPEGEYFIVENRQRVGYDASLPASGLLIFHVDENASNNDNQLHRLVDLEQADGKRQLNGRGEADDGDPFPLPGNAAFTPATVPNSLGYGASSGAIYVEAIRRDGADVAFSVALRAPLPVGGRCLAGGQCASGFCVEGTCCDTACDAGACETCLRASGATADGVCTQLSGDACDDGNPCTYEDRCSAGVCAAGAEVRCPAIDSCHTDGVCDPSTGRCTAPRLPDGVACDDRNACTSGDRCAAGRCEGLDKVVCEAAAECRLASVCDASSGTCSAPAAPDGTACAGGTCEGGACVRKCGCQSGSAGDLAPVAALLALVLRRRRR